MWCEEGMWHAWDEWKIYSTYTWTDFDWMTGRMFRLDRWCGWMGVNQSLFWRVRPLRCDVVSLGECFRAFWRIIVTSYSNNPKNTFVVRHFEPRIVATFVVVDVQTLYTQSARTFVTVTGSHLDFYWFACRRIEVLKKLSHWQDIVL